MERTKRDERAVAVERKREWSEVDGEDEARRRRNQCGTRAGEERVRETRVRRERRVEERRGPREQQWRQRECEVEGPAAQVSERRPGQRAVILRRLLPMRGCYESSQHDQHWDADAENASMASPPSR